MAHPEIAISMAQPAAVHGAERPACCGAQQSAVTQPWRDQGERDVFAATECCLSPFAVVAVDSRA